MQSEDTKDSSKKYSICFELPDGHRTTVIVQGEDKEAVEELNRNIRYYVSESTR